MKTVTAFQNFGKATSQSWFSGFFVFLRVLLGTQFLISGISKINDWSAESYLQYASGPFAEWFQTLAGNALVDQLNIWGQIFIGLALILGVFVRPASFFGIILMLLYYFAQFEQNVVSGFIDPHIIYSVVFLIFLSGGIGHIFGLDGLIFRNIRKKRTLTKILFG